MRIKYFLLKCSKSSSTVNYSSVNVVFPQSVFYYSHMLFWIMNSTPQSSMFMCGNMWKFHLHLYFLKAHEKSCNFILKGKTGLSQSQVKVQHVTFPIYVEFCVFDRKYKHGDSVCNYLQCRYRWNIRRLKGLVVSVWCFHGNSVP